MFGTPVPVLGTFNLGVFKEDQVNIVVHGHEPLLPELLVTASRDPEMKAPAEKVGARASTLPVCAAQPMKYSCATASPALATSCSRNWLW